MQARSKKVARKNRRGWTRSLLWKDDGAASVFSIMVLSSLLLFFGLLIDYARIAAMHKLTEDAARAGVRSVLSAYDASLYERYGLFGRGGTDGSKLFAEAAQFNLNMSPYNGKQMIRMVDVRVESAELYTAGVLGDHRIFARQLLEDMKYKAPIDFTLEIVTKFAPMAISLKESSSAIDVLERMRKLYEQREDELAEALRLQRQAAEAIRSSGVKEAITGGEAYGPTASASSLAQRYEEYASQVQHDIAIEQYEQPKYGKEIALYRSQATALMNRLQSRFAELNAQHPQLLAAARERLNAAETINEEMRTAMQEAQQEDGNDGFDTVAGSSASVSSEAELSDIKNSAERLIRSPEWFANYHSELSGQEQQYESLRNAASDFQAQLSAAVTEASSTGGRGQALRSSVSHLSRAYAEYEQRYIQPGTILESREQELQEGDVKAKLKEQKKVADSKWKQATALLGGFSSLQAGSEEKEQFQEVKQRYEKNLQFNAALIEAEEEAGYVAGETPASANDAASKSSTAIRGIFAGMAGMLEKARDDLYYGEYVIHRFNSFPPEELKPMMEGGNLDSLGSALSYVNQEAEYVLYGFHNPIGNVAAAYGELFAIRLAIRTMEGLLESRSLGHPLLILSAALIYGLEKTMEDMLVFANRGAAPLSKFIKVDVSYNDYLRLFMLMHGGNEATRLSRMIAVIEQNRKITLSEVPAAVTGEVQASIGLWFIPSIVKALGRTGLLKGKVVGGRYETSETIGSSY